VNVLFLLCYLLSFILLSILFLPTTATASGRILSLDLCTDWMLAKYATNSQVLALSPLLHQVPVDWIKKDWPTHDGSLERILALKPDLVITGEYNAIMLRKRLQELGINVEILALPKNLSEVDEYENHFLSLLGLPANNIHKTYNTYNDRNKEVSTVSQHGSKHRLLLLGPNGIGTGRSTFEDDIITQADWSNYLEGNGYISLDLESIAVNPPDAILWSASGTRALANLFANHPVLKKIIPKERWLKTVAWQWRCPGPWTWDLVNQLHSALPAVSKR